MSGLGEHTHALCNEAGLAEVSAKPLVAQPR
jgi:hypothetical protein